MTIDGSGGTESGNMSKATKHNSSLTATAIDDAATGDNEQIRMVIAAGDADGNTHLHHGRTQLERLNSMDNHDGKSIIPVKHSYNNQNDATISFLRAARSGDLGKVLEFLNTKQVVDINTSNANGLNALHLAAKDGYIDITIELLQRGIQVDNATKKGNTALHIASLAGQKEIIKLLLQHNANVNVQSQNGFTPLYMAAQENHDACVRFLLAKGANASLATEDGFTPLAVAMQQGHGKVVAVLLEGDARGKVRLPALHIAAKKNDVNAARVLLQNENNLPDIVSKSGFTPLHIAAHYGNVDIANLLIERGSNVNYTAKHNITPLHVACKWGKSEILMLLLEHNAVINATTRDGLTPLHCAARSGHVDVIKILLANNAPILSKTKNGLAPLHMAAQGEHDEAACLLLQHKAPVDEITVDFLTALHVAAHCGHVRVAKLLLDYKADANARALNGFTPLHIACKKNRIKVVELLLKHGANIAATTESGLTPLHVASFMGCMNIVIYLLQHDADSAAATVRGETPLHLAARANQTDIIRILLRNDSRVDARAREGQTALHVSSRLGNIDIIMLLVQHGADVNAQTKDAYTPLHIAAKEGQEEVVQLLLEHGANFQATTKKAFTPLHLAAKYGKHQVATQLLQKGALIDCPGKNDVTPLHVATHYDHARIVRLLLDNGSSPQLCARNGHNALHIASKKNQLEIAEQLLQHGANADVRSKAGFSPLHLASQEGHLDVIELLVAHKADVQGVARNGLTPLHLCAQEDRIVVARLLLDNGANISERTKAGYTPLHVAAHYGQIDMVKFLLANDANIEMVTNCGYTPLHQAAQQGHTMIINLLLRNKANPNAISNCGHTPLSIANSLGYVTAVETLKVVTETAITQTIGDQLEQKVMPGTKFKVITPEQIHETFLTDSEDDEGGDAEQHDDDQQHYHNQYKYMVSDDLRANNNNDDDPDPEHEHDPELDHNELQQRSNDHTTETYPRIGNQYSIKNNNNDQDTRDDDTKINQERPPLKEDDPVGGGTINAQEIKSKKSMMSPLTIVVASAKKDQNIQVDNVDIVRSSPIHFGFLVSFLVDARGGSMRGCRHSGVRVIVPPKACTQPTRITCRYVKPQRVHNPPPLMEGEALVSRIIELSPVGAAFTRPVILEVPHFGSLRDKEREIIILRSDNGETWREHTLYDSEDTIAHMLQDAHYDTESQHPLEELHTSRLVRVVARNFPHFFAVVSRIRQEVYAIGPDGGTVASLAVPSVHAIFPPHALTKKIRVGLQAQAVDLGMCTKCLGQGVAASPVVTVEPRRRKFHKAITLKIPAPRFHSQGMTNAPTYTTGSTVASTLRLLCSITGGQNRAMWEDVTGSTPLEFAKDSVAFTTTVSARFWLMDCRHISEASRMATELYASMTQVPFMVQFVVYAKRISATQARLSVFCMTDDKEDKTLEHQDNFIEVAKSRDVEVLGDQDIYLELGGVGGLTSVGSYSGGNLVPVLKTGSHLHIKFQAFRENRLGFLVHIKDPENPFGHIYFLSEPRVASTTTSCGVGRLPQQPICMLNLSLDEATVGGVLRDRNGNGSQLSVQSIKSAASAVIPAGAAAKVGGVIDRGLTYRNLINAGNKAQKLGQEHLYNQQIDQQNTVIFPNHLRSQQSCTNSDFRKVSLADHSSHYNEDNVIHEQEHSCFDRAPHDNNPLHELLKTDLPNNGIIQHAVLSDFEVPILHKQMSLQQTNRLISEEYNEINEPSHLKRTVKASYIVAANEQVIPITDEFIVELQESSCQPSSPVAQLNSTANPFEGRELAADCIQNIIGIAHEKSESVLDEPNRRVGSKFNDATATKMVDADLSTILAAPFAASTCYDNLCTSPSSSKLPECVGNVKCESPK